MQCRVPFLLCPRPGWTYFFGFANSLVAPQGLIVNKAAGEGGPLHGRNTLTSNFKHVALLKKKGSMQKVGEEEEEEEEEKEEEEEEAPYHPKPGHKIPIKTVYCREEIGTQDEKTSNISNQNPKNHRKGLNRQPSHLLKYIHIHDLLHLSLSARSKTTFHRNSTTQPIYYTICFGNYVYLGTILP
ncbi:uncharacterized protein RSE6_05023 [Rhynchosporium secalis]|uniref:Uncharacterized protein n=1 Tax=Rhynchosporium secalis TaxID=38038 RepID=A0A1E1M6R7_RHYSE|nr:uncharacterized protein RSE6_05023 [Rhynchosporium secalis]